MRDASAGCVPTLAEHATDRPPDDAAGAVVRPDNRGMTAVTLATREWPPASGAVDAAPVAFLVHGVTGWHRTWWRVGPALAMRGWRVVAVDQRGHGTSPRAGPSTIDDLADDLEAAIEAQAAAPIDLLIGHSLGAVASLALVRRRPDITRRMVLEDPPSLDRHDDDGFLDRLRREASAAREDPDAEVRRELAENPAWVETDARQNVEGRALSDTEGIVASLRIPRPFRVPAEASSVAVPTLYILGDEERSVMVGAARRELEAALPPTSEIAVLGAGHTVHRDRFGEYMTTLLGWLERS
jgi:pimeloyl-ACP methyl ester carboxylesterase